MKNFNKTITIFVPVNAIAEKLLAQTLPDFKHRELVTETIIGSLDEYGLSNLYNALNGFSLDINFKIGDHILPNSNCTLKARTYFVNAENKLASEWLPVNEGYVKEIDVCAKKKILVKYQTIDSDRNPVIHEEWQDHKHWDIALPVGLKETTEETEPVKDDAFAHLKNTDEVIRDLIIGETKTTEA